MAVEFDKPIKYASHETNKKIDVISKVEADMLKNTCDLRPYKIVANPMRFSLYI